MEFWCWFEYQWPNFVIFSFLLLILVKKYKHVKIKKTMLLCYGWFLCTHQWNNQENRFMYFLLKSEKSENFSSWSTGKEKLIDLSNKLQDELLKDITDLSIIQYHSNRLL